MSLQANPASDAWYRSVEKTSQTDDERIKDITVLPPPEHLIRFSPSATRRWKGSSARPARTSTTSWRAMTTACWSSSAPAPSTTPQLRIDYARRLKVVRASSTSRHAGNRDARVLRKARTTVGWKGLINDPYLDESYRIDEGLRIARQLLIDINRLGMPRAASSWT